MLPNLNFVASIICVCVCVYVYTCYIRVHIYTNICQLLRLGIFKGILITLWNDYLLYYNKAFEIISCGFTFIVFDITCFFVFFWVILFLGVSFVCACVCVRFKSNLFKLHHSITLHWIHIFLISLLDNMFSPCLSCTPNFISPECHFTTQSINTCIYIEYFRNITT